MGFMRFVRSDNPKRPVESGPDLAAETEAVRSIVGRLESMPPEQARFLAATAYVLARAAYADMNISDEETAIMERELGVAGLDASQAILVVEMAKLQERTTGATSDYLVTREFRDNSSAEQRLALLRACFLVCAADDAISGTESSTLSEIANELDVPRADLTALRAQFADKFSARFGGRSEP